MIQQRGLGEAAHRAGEVQGLDQQLRGSRVPPTVVCQGGQGVVVLSCLNCGPAQSAGGGSVPRLQEMLQLGGVAGGGSGALPPHVAHGRKSIHAPSALHDPPRGRAWLLPRSR